MSLNTWTNEAENKAENKEQVEKVFRRLLKGGAMRRLPKNKKDLQVFLALAVSAMDPQRQYDEPELNARLIEWMTGFTDPEVMDHVTIRRYLVDYFYLRRDVPGTRYKTNQTMINTVIQPEARSVLPLVLLEEIQRDQAHRRRVNSP